MVLGGATTAPAPGNRHQRWAQTGVLVLTCKTWSYRRRQGCVVIVTSTEGRVCGRRPGCVVLVTRTESPFGGSLFNIVHGGTGGALLCVCAPTALAVFPENENAALCSYILKHVVRSFS